MNNKIIILSNISINFFNKDLLKDTQIELCLGDYNNIVQNSYNINDSYITIVFWEAANLIEDFEYKIELFNKNEYEEFLEKTKSEIALVLKNASKAKLVLFNKFSANYINTLQNHNSQYLNFVKSLNEYIYGFEYTNIKIIDIEKIFQKISVEKCIDLRFYNQYKTLYTDEFFKRYTKLISMHINLVFGKIKKVLILDCDNTIWDGIVGEGEVIPRKEVQYIAKYLAKYGIVLCLCSKNNESDVLNVFANNQNMILTLDDIVLYKINWQDKASNVQAIANELNIGLDSIVFIDDSEFEIGLINSKLPQVDTILLSTKRHIRTIQMRELVDLFSFDNLTTEDLNKTQIYRQELKRKSDKGQFANIDDYLSSLGICIEVKVNDVSITGRIAQLTQKTNQFNLTTQRYSQTEIEGMQQNNYYTFSGNVFDRYGDSGLTVVVIVKKESSECCSIDTFLMSCRVLGRNIEYAIFDYIIQYLKSKGFQYIKSQYIATQKNTQVADFYDRLGFELINIGDNTNKMYNLMLKDYNKKNIDYINIKEQ